MLTEVLSQYDPQAAFGAGCFWTEKFFRKKFGGPSRPSGSGTWAGPRQTGNTTQSALSSAAESGDHSARLARFFFRLLIGIVKREDMVNNAPRRPAPQRSHGLR